MEREVNEEKRKKFFEYAEKRVNNVLHDIQILEPMARSNSYDFTKADVEGMFNAMQETLNEAKEEFNKKFDEKARAEKKTFSFGMAVPSANIANDASFAENIQEPKLQEVAANIAEEVPEVTETLNTLEPELIEETAGFEGLEDTGIDFPVNEIEE